MLNFALKYLKQGLSVIPLEPKGKRPLISWTEFQSRHATEEEVQVWFQKWPNANLGVVTGRISGIAVVDLDGAEGLKSASDLGLTSSVVSLTGGGKHLWYQNPVSVVVTNAVRIAPGLDVRGEGGYVVAPPSIAANGRRYRWNGAVSADFKNRLPPFPSGLSTATNAAQPSHTSIKEESWIAKALEGMRVGNIDDTLTSILGRLRHDGYSAADAEMLLKPHAVSAGAVDGHLEEKIENVWSRYEAKKSTVVENEDAESVSDFLAVEEEPKWIIPGVLTQPSIAFCVGLPESNKTWLLMDLAIEASRGGDWIGLFSVSRTKTLFIDQERPRAETKRRLNALLGAKGLRRSDMGNLFLKSGSSIKIDLENSYGAFQRLMEKIQPGLVIVDSLATFHSKEENSRMDIQIVMERIKQLREKFNCTFLFIHHANKFAFQAASEGKEPTIGEMAGSIALPAAAETVLTVQKAKGGGSTVFHTKSTQALKQSPFGILVEDTDKGIQVRGVK